jgi:hypothetical protein
MFLKKGCFDINMGFDTLEKTREVSEFNEAINQIMRLNYLWNSIARFRESGKLQQARWKLDTVELELMHDAKKVDKEKGSTYVKQIEAINKTIQLVDFKVHRITKGKDYDEVDIRKLYNSLIYNLIIKKEAILREIQEEAGKGGSYKSANEDDMD